MSLFGGIDSELFAGGCHGALTPRGSLPPFRTPRAYALLPGNDDARDDPKSHLREHKPEPVDALAEHRIHDSENAVNQTRPQDGRDETSQ